MTVLKREDLKSVVVWVKIHNVPMATYTEDGLSLLATKLGTPKLLDTYTNTMCMESWGRSSYARALVEISADLDYKEQLVIAITNLEGEGYITETMKVEYEWKPPRCGHCNIFSHEGTQCPKVVKPVQKQKPTMDEEGFEIVKRKDKANAKQGFHVKNQKQKFEYRPVTKPSSKEASSSKGPVLSNKHEFLNEYGTGHNEPLYVPAPEKEKSSGQLDDPKEDDEEVFNEMDDYMKSNTTPKTNSEGASIPGSNGFDG
uniref:uncharacterized protein LOC122587776 n=1 Tax=Erigeron canadensis TaxID=72917 RepID=UPI001CB8C720|nr:uncharacterized protein LOC122587776 [Erigeron canadensis]